MSAATRYEIERHLDEGIIVLTPTGPFDDMDVDAQFALAAQFLKDHATAKGAIVNLAFIGHIASKPIGLIADLASRLEDTGTKLVIAHAQKVIDALHICGIDEVIPVKATLAEAKKLVLAGPGAQPKAPEVDPTAFFSTRPSTSTVIPTSAPVLPDVLPQEVTNKTDSFAPELVPEVSLFDVPASLPEPAVAQAPAAEPVAAPISAPAASENSFLDVLSDVADEQPAVVVPEPVTTPQDQPDFGSSGFSVDPAEKMTAILLDAAAKLRDNSAGFDVRRKDLEETVSGKQARIDALNTEVKTLRAELKSLEKEEARVTAAIASFQASGD